MDKSSAVETNASCGAAPDCEVLSDCIQCCSEANEIPTVSQLVVVTHQMAEWKDKQRELVIVKDNFLPFHFSHSTRNELPK